MILLLSGLTPQQDKLREIYIGRIKQTKEYKRILNLNQYEYITKQAKQLQIRIQNINIERATISEIQVEHQKLMSLVKDFQSLLDASTARLRNNNYHIDIIPKSALKELKTSDADLYTKIQIKMKSNTDSTAEAFRNYIKTSARPLIIQEYIKNRTPELAALDQKRAQAFMWGGAVIGAIICMLLLHFFLPVPFGVEAGIMGISLILFGLGLFNVHWSLRLYTVGLLTAYMLFFVGASFAQEFGFLSETFDSQALRALHLYVLLGFVGALAGMHVGIRVNFIPADQTFHLPSFLAYLERRLLFLTVAFGIFGFIWTNAFFDGMTVYQSIAATVENHINEKTGIHAFNSDSAGEPLGQLTVTSQYANVRTEPTVVDETIFGQVTQGTVLTYYDYQDVNGRIWYHVLEEESSTLVWISELTVQKME